MRYTPLAHVQGMRRRSSSVAPDLLSRTRTSRGVRAPMSPWSVSTGERKAEWTPRETSVWESLCATKPNFRTSESVKPCV
ncbi:hypothetical protein SLA2020_263170 [Shorea laevis]